MSSLPSSRSRPLLAVVSLAVMLAGCGKGRPVETDRASAAVPPGTPAARPASPAAPAKPSQPIAMEFVAETPSDAGAAVRIQLAVTASLDLPDCVVTVRLPAGAMLAEGNLTWRGALACDRRQVNAFAIRVPGGQRCEVTAAVRAELDGGTIVAREATLVLNPDAATAKPDAQPGTLKTNSRGEQIHELPGGDLK